jgi:hypothetical protein
MPIKILAEEGKDLKAHPSLTEAVYYQRESFYAN